MTEPQMTTADAAHDLRIMAASIIVDHDNYKGRLLAIADWIEHNFAAMLTSKSISFHQEPWPDNEITKHYKEMLAWLQNDIAMLRNNQAQKRADLDELKGVLGFDLMKLKQTYPDLETDERFQRIEQMVRGE